MTKSVYEIIPEKIIEKLEKGVYLGASPGPIQMWSTGKYKNQTEESIFF